MPGGEIRRRMWGKGNVGRTLTGGWTQRMIREYTVNLVPDSIEKIHKSCDSRSGSDSFSFLLLPFALIQLNYKGKEGRVNLIEWKTKEKEGRESHSAPVLLLQPHCEEMVVCFMLSSLFLSCLFINCLSHMSLKDEGREPSAKETGTSLSAWWVRPCARLFQLSLAYFMLSLRSTTLHYK